MLLPWSKPASILIAPEGLAMCHAHSARAQALSCHDTPVGWEQLLQELSSQLPNLGLRNARFVISSYFVRYAVLPWQAGILSRQDWQGLAEHHFRKIFGNASDSWEIQITLQDYGQNIIAAAIDRGFLQQMEEIAKQSGTRIHSIEPMLAAVINQYGKRMQHDDLLLIAEPHHMLLAEIPAGNWQQFIVATPPIGQAQQECASMLARAMIGNSREGATRLAFFGPSEVLPNTMQGLHTSHLSRHYKGSVSVFMFE